MLHYIDQSLGIANVFPEYPRNADWWVTFAWPYMVVADGWIVGYIALTEIEPPIATIHAGAFGRLPPEMIKTTWELFEAAILCGSDVRTFQADIPLDRRAAAMAAHRFGFTVTKQEDHYHVQKTES